MNAVEFQQAGQKVMSAIIAALSKMADKENVPPVEAVVFALLAAAVIQTDKSLRITDRAAFLRLAGEIWDGHRRHPSG